MTAPSPHVLCPRCAYDVSGPVPTWPDAGACPLEGTCTECGLRFEWVDLFRPERIYPRWSFEHARSWHLLALIRTLWRPLVPSNLWGQMRLAAPVRLVRLLILVIIALLTAHIGVIGVRYASGTVALWRSVWFVSGSVRMTPRPSFDFDALRNLLLWPYGSEWDRLIGPLGLIILAWGALAPLPFFVLQQTLAKSKVRPAHLLRAWAYSVVLLAAILLLDALLMGGQVYIYRNSIIPVSPLFSMLGVLLWIIACFWLARWWWLFTSTYLHLPRPGKVTTVMLAISLLAALVLCVLIDPMTRNAIGSLLNGVIGWNAY
jgi:hypothetical protein